MYCECRVYMDSRVRFSVLLLIYALSDAQYWFSMDILALTFFNLLRLV